MGNCAGKSKDLETEREAPLPATEAPAVEAGAATVPQEQDVGEAKKEEPSAETTEAAPEPAKAEEPTEAVEPAVEAKPVEVEAASSEAAKPAAEAKVEAPVATA